MQIVKVNLLKTETSWAALVGIARRKQAIDLDISAVPPSEAADNFHMHLRDSPAAPEESAREHIQRTIPKAASGSAWIPPQVSDDELRVCSIFECEDSQSAIWLRILLLKPVWIPIDCSVLFLSNFDDFSDFRYNFRRIPKLYYL